MGISSFLKAFKSTRYPMKKSDIKGSTIYIDIMSVLYSIFHATNKVAAKKENEGETQNTLWVGVLISKHIGFIKSNINVYYVYDNPKAPSIKDHELQKRRTNRQKARDLLIEIKKIDLSEESKIDINKIDDTDDPIMKKLKSDALGIVSSSDKNKKIQSLKSRTFVMTGNIIEQSKQILALLGATIIETPYGYEGEQVAAHMAVHDMSKSPGRVVYVLSGDSDVLIFGAHIVNKYYIKIIKEAREAKNTGKKYIMPVIPDIMLLKRVIGRQQSGNVFAFKYSLRDIMINTKNDCNALVKAGKTTNNSRFTLRNFIECAIHLGCDFAPKTHGWGPGTVLRKYRNKKAELTEDQRKAYNMFRKELDLKDVVVINNKPDIESLLGILGHLNFNITLWTKRITQVIPIKSK